MRILKLFELKELCFLSSLLISLDIIQGPPPVACSNLLVSEVIKENSLSAFNYLDDFCVVLFHSESKSSGFNAYERL